ncbi:MAG: hypothetical protein COB84_06155 [Rhodobacteraceae bacterium]|nr:MAG: hypothetical protein COB84_06155 [Paracoccaceae bacterium]
MQKIITIYDQFVALIDRIAGAWLLPTLARFSFAAVLLIYFWNSAKTKIGDGIFGFLSPSDTAYIQIFPKAFEAAGYDSAGLNTFHWLVAVAGTTAEFILPLLILVGLFTRLAALGMIGFIFVQSIVDITGHGVGGSDLGAWFDGAPDALILDQRLLWVSILIILVVKGAGVISVDRLLRR